MVLSLHKLVPDFSYQVLFNIKSFFMSLTILCIYHVVSLSNIGTSRFSCKGFTGINSLSSSQDPGAAMILL